MPRRCPTRFRAALVLAACLGILALPAQALPPGSSDPLHAAVSAGADWLSRLSGLLGTLWTRATAETGMSIDPDGRPDAQPGDGPSADTDTGMSIDPNG